MGRLVDTFDQWALADRHRRPRATSALRANPNRHAAPIDSRPVQRRDPNHHLGPPATDRTTPGSTSPYPLATARSVTTEASSWMPQECTYYVSHPERDVHVARPSRPDHD